MSRFCLDFENNMGKERKCWILWENGSFWKPISACSFPFHGSFHDLLKPKRGKKNNKKLVIYCYEVRSVVVLTHCLLRRWVWFFALSYGLSLIDIRVYVDAKQSCIFHVFTPLDLTVGWCKWDFGFGQAMEASTKSGFCALCWPWCKLYMYGRYSFP